MSRLDRAARQAARRDADDAEPASRRTPPRSKPAQTRLRLVPQRHAAARVEPAPLGRKARRRLARGADAIDGRLDLHGLTQAQAHDALLGYLRTARGRGAKVVLVITGKGGASSYEGRGVLKRQVPMWLRLPEFREHVVGFESAGIGHGGEGAMYARLRRASCL